MPTYCYECSKCKHYFEDLLSISRMDSHCEAPCPSCNEENAVERVLGATPVVSGVLGAGNMKLGGFHDVLDKVKKAHPRSHLARKGSRLE